MKCLRCEGWQRQGLSDTCPACDMIAQSKSKPRRVTAYAEGNRVEITTGNGSMRLIFAEDGTFRVITDLKTTNVQSLLDKDPMHKYQRVVEVEFFGHPYED